MDCDSFEALLACFIKLDCSGVVDIRQSNSSGGFTTIWKQCSLIGCRQAFGRVIVRLGIECGPWPSIVSVKPKFVGSICTPLADWFFVLGFPGVAAYALACGACCAVRG